MACVYSPFPHDLVAYHTVIRIVSYASNKWVIEVLDSDMFHWKQSKALDYWDQCIHVPAKGFWPVSA